MKKSLVEQIQMALSPDAAEGNEDIRVNSLAPIGGEGGLPWRTGWGGCSTANFFTRSPSKEESVTFSSLVVAAQTARETSYLFNVIDSETFVGDEENSHVSVRTGSMFHDFPLREPDKRARAKSPFVGHQSSF